MTNDIPNIKFGTDGWRAIVGKEFNHKNVEIVTKAIEPLRADKQVGSSLEVAVYVQSEDEVNKKVLLANEDELGNIFITSQAYITEKAPENVLNTLSEEGYTIYVTKAEGEKCERCWKYRKLGNNSTHATLCDECVEAIS